MDKIDEVIKLVEKEFFKFHKREFCCHPCLEEETGKLESEIIWLIETLRETKDERSE